MGGAAQLESVIAVVNDIDAILAILFRCCLQINSGE